MFAVCCADHDRRSVGGGRRGCDARAAGGGGVGCGHAFLREEDRAAGGRGVGG